MPQRVSLCLIAKNEEANLPACLSSVADLVEEIIVVDTGSTDRTQEVAAASGARVFDFAWIDDFAAARNESIRHATGEWILWLDGDEHFDDENRRKLRELFAGLKEEHAAYVLTQRSTPEDPGGSPTVVTQVRLFRNLPCIRWRYRVHEQILPALRQAGHDVRFTDIALEHTGYQDPALRQQKTERNLRLLHLEDAEHPDDPFTLFNLGWAYQELGQVVQALPLLRRSLARSRPGDSIVRKLYALLAQGHRRLGQPREALAACRAGRARCPDDPELLFLEGQMRAEHGDGNGAVACLQRLLETEPGAHFASVNAGLRGPTARHFLAQLYWRQGHGAEAEEQWQTAVAQQPRFGPAWQGLGERYLAEGRWAELEQAAGHLRAEEAFACEGLVLQARGHLARQEFGPARRLLEEAMAREPHAVGPRVFLTHALLQNHDLAAAEPALRAVLELDPRQAESWRNLAVLLKAQERLGEATAVCQAGLGHCPADDDLLSLLAELCAQQGDLPAAEACLLHLLERPAENGTNGKPPAERRLRARSRLALLYRRQGRLAEAEAQCRAVLAERPDSLGAWAELAELCLAQQRWPELEQAAQRLEADPSAWLDAALLRARGHRARREFAAARQLLAATRVRDPDAVGPCLVLSQALLQEGEDPAEAERALREVLQRNPDHAEARHNLAVLLRRQGPVSERPAAHGTSPAGDEDVAAAIPRPQRSQALRLAFASFSPFGFSIDTPYQVPLGGSESALCYLAEALAQQGHEVFLLNAGTVPAVCRGVRCLPLSAASIRELGPLDAFVVQNRAGKARELRPLLGSDARLVLWSQHAHDQPAVQALRDPGERQAYDQIALVSAWQREQYLQHFALDPNRVAVLRNAIGPAFAALFPDHTAVLAHKAKPPVLAYTSTPFRGLDLLLEAFPRIRRAVPGVSLKVFSGMRVYQLPEAEEQARYGALYRRCRATEGVEYVSSLPQPELANHLRSVSVLAYPNTFAETSCIAVLEALASGCQVVTSDLGALPETTGGFARLIQLEEDWETYLDRFIEAVVQVLGRLTGPEASEEEQCLRRQVVDVNQNATWSVRAQQWAQWLRRVRARTA